MEKLTARGRDRLDRIMSWGEHPSQTSPPAWALATPQRGPDDCTSCGLPIDEDGVCELGCEPLQGVAS